MTTLRKRDSWFNLINEIRESHHGSHVAFWNYSGDRLTRSQVKGLLLSSFDRWNEFKAKQKNRLIWYHVGEEVFWLPGYIIKLHDSDFKNRNLSHRDLSSVDFTHSDFRRTNFSYSSLGNVSSGGLVDYTRLIGCDCRSAKFVVTRFDGARASATNFSSAEFNGATLNRVDLRNSIFHKAFFAAEVTNCDLQGADFSGCHILGSSFFETNISNAKNFEGADFGDYCRVDYKTIKLSKKIPRNFLRACGVANDHIKYIDKIANNSHRLPNCFVSYSDADRTFVTKFTNALEGRGIRTWLAPRDLPFGASTREYLEDAIRRHDKLVLVLSKRSLASSWVEFEVETAFELEQKKGVNIVVPLTIDGSVFNTKSSWGRHLARTRNIADCRRWKSSNTEMVDEFIHRLQTTKLGMK